MRIEFLVFVLILVLAAILSISFASVIGAIPVEKPIVGGTQITNFQECAAAGFPVMESYPRQCSDGANTFTEDVPVSYQTSVDICGSMGLAQAMRIALENCGSALTGTAMCNDVTGTWWLDLNINRTGCAPACVIDVTTGQAEINWRCTGLIA